MADSARPDLVETVIRAPIWGNIEWKDSALRLMLDDPRMQGDHLAELGSSVVRAG
jgi:hypothetical protein